MSIQSTPTHHPQNQPISPQLPTHTHPCAPPPCPWWGCATGRRPHPGCGRCRTARAPIYLCIYMFLCETRATRPPSPERRSKVSHADPRKGMGRDAPSRPCPASGASTAAARSRRRPPRRRPVVVLGVGLGCVGRDATPIIWPTAPASRIVSKPKPKRLNIE